MSGQVTAQTIYGADDRVRVGDPLAFPWASIGAVQVSFEGGGGGRGTGFMVGPQHMLTAGHVVHDAVRGGAESLTVAFAKDGAVEPFGRAEAVSVRAPEGWTESADPTEDWALVTLDRSIGTFTGHMDLGAVPIVDFYDGVPVTLAGYPGDLDAGEVLYAAAGPVLEGTPAHLRYAGTLDTAGGMSGAPVWQTFSGSGTRQVIGIHIAGGIPDAPGSANIATRLSPERLSLIDEWIGQDALIAPPRDLPDLGDRDAADETATARLSVSEVAAGGRTELTLAVVNRGTLAAGAFEIVAYASSNSTITEFDAELARTSLAGLGPFAAAEITLSLAVPAALPAGSYRVGWLIDPADEVEEFDDLANLGLLAQSLIVAAMPDLAASGLTLSSTSWRAGDGVSAAWSLANLGGAGAPPAGATLYLSQDPQITAEDIALAAGPESPFLAPDQSAPAAAAFTVPEGLASGAYFVGVLADPGGAVAEADRGNNASAPVAITLSAPGALIEGTGGPDGLTGSAGDDTLVGFRGADTLSGRDGADSLEGGGEADRIFGEGGDDVLLGGPGADTLLGQAGRDLIRGDLGDGVSGQGDLLNGGPGEDTLIGEGGPDTLFGEDGDDSLIGGPGIDRLGGNAGADTLDGGDKRDTVDGGADNDSLEGGEGNDLVYGGDGDDTASGGPGPDFIDGEAGDDLIDAGPDDDIAKGGGGADTISGGAGLDRLFGGDGPDRLSGEAGDDRAYGEAGPDTLEGGEGDDFLNGNDGDDSVSGGEGADTLRGGEGADTLDGGPGNDAVAGREGDDRLTGGDGDDALDGEAGADTLEGGAGADALRGKAGADSLSGGAGDDSLFAGGDGDTLIGGPGDDRLAGEAGIDRFVFAAGDGADLIFDFDPVAETLLFIGGAARFEDLSLFEGPEGWLVVGHSADPADTVTLQGLRPGDLTDDGSVSFG